MYKSLLIITCEYPYITGEPFLENEMLYLQQRFDNIYIFPINASPRDVPTRTVPENVKVYPVGCVWSKLRYPVYALKGFFTYNKKLTTKGLSLKQKVSAWYARGRSAHIHDFIMATIEREKLDVSDACIYSYWFTDQAVAAWKLKETLQSMDCNVKAVARGHGYDVYAAANAMNYLPYQQQNLQWLDGFYPCSDNGGNYIAEKYPLYRKKIHTARLGTMDKGHNRFSGEEKVFLTCSSLKPIKRMSLFAKAFAILCKRAPNCRWVCIGDGAMENDIREIIHNEGIEDHVEMLGRLTNQQVLEYYSTHGITYFCNVSSTEGVPVSIMEAMSFGIPIIATDVGGSGEIVSDRVGRLLPAELTPEMLADYLYEEMMLSNESYLQKRENARLSWEEKSSADKVYKQWCDILAQE